MSFLWYLQKTVGGDEPMEEFLVAYIKFFRELIKASSSTALSFASDALSLLLGAFDQQSCRRCCCWVRFLTEWFSVWVGSGRHALTSERFKTFFLEYFSLRLPAATLESIDWDTWLYSPGMPPELPEPVRCQP